MKKILWLVILFPIFTSRVLASEVYYSNYGNFSEYQESFINSSDTVNVESKVMYRWYKNVQVPSDYKPYNSKDDFLNNCYETAYSDWSLNYPNLTESIIIDEKTVYNYQMVEPIRYIHLYDLKGSYSAFRIPELQVFYNNQEINYTYTCNGCWPNFDNYIHNGIWVESESYIDNGGSLIIDLGGYYPINKIKLMFYLFDIGTIDKEYTIGFSKDQNNIFISKKFIQRFSNQLFVDAKKFEYMVTDIENDSNKWLTYKNTEEYIDNEYLYSKDSYKQYRYKDKICQTFIWDKQYYPYYSDIQVLDYNLKENEKMFYRYQTRDKLELNIHDITEKYYDLNNFVISSTSNYTIDNNINWEKNGTYKLNFKTSNISVEKDIKLVILENSLEEKDEQIKKLEDELKNTIFNYEKIIEQLENTNKEFLSDLNNLNNEIININNKIIELEQTENINNSVLESLRKDLDNHINLYNLKVEEIEKTNQKYTENITMLLNSINKLGEEINLIKEDTSNNTSNIDKLNEDIMFYTNELNIKINYLESLNTTYLEKLHNLEIYIKTTNDKLNELENKYNDLTNKVDKLEDDIKEIDKLNDLIDELFNEVYILHNNDDIEKENLKQVEKQLEEALILYQNKIESLEKFNSDGLLKLTKLQEEIYLLQEEINSLEETNNINIDILKQQLDDKSKEYTNKINEIEDFNDNYSKKLESTNVKLLDIINQINEMKIINEDVYKNLSGQVQLSFDEVESIKDTFYITIEDFKKEDNLLNEKLNNIEINNNDNYIKIMEELEKTNQYYEQLIKRLKQTNDDYIIQIKLLNDEINNIKYLFNEQYNTLTENQNLLKEQLLSLSDEIISNYEQNLEKINVDLKEVSKQLNDDKKENLKFDLDDYVLKINGVDTINFLWVYIILSGSFVFYVLYLFKKRKNNN